ncbi:MAG: type II/IV secretion system protein [Gammaproteobacteria bacterium]|nr:type II/IV secretion system protein [Gammaproteobacteria bacterium]
MNEPATVPGDSLDTDTLCAALRRRGIISARQVAELKAGRAPDDQRHPLEVIADQGWQAAGPEPYPLTLETLTRLTAECFGLPYFRIDPLKTDVQAVTSLVSQAYAERYGFLPVASNDREVTVAVDEPFPSDWEVELGRILKRSIRRVLVNPQELKRYLKEFYGVSRSISGATASKAAEQPAIASNFEQLTQLGATGELDANDRHVVHVTDWLLQFAFEQRASDIHIEPRREQSNIRFRIDGVLHLVHQLPTPVVAAITSRLKSLGRMDVADKRRPQDGRIKTMTPAGLEVEMRLSTMPTTFGEKLVMRIFNPEMLSKNYAELGFNENEREILARMTGARHGIILVTGPTGSGKTTTLYSTLKQIARPEINVCSIEDPIEMVEPAFNQMQVQPAIDLDFAAGVRTLMRQDPDVIMIGEIRDRETADVAIQAALTGHLVLSTLHTNDAPSAVTRLLDIGVQPFLIGATLLGVVAQRLIRTLCPHCRKTVPASAAAWASLGTAVACPVEVCEPTGCDECRQTGYLGRSGIYEILELDDELRAGIRPELNSISLREAALAHGMTELRDSAAAKIAAGLTTVEEVLSVLSVATNR